MNFAIHAHWTFSSNTEVQIGDRGGTPHREQLPRLRTIDERIQRNKREYLWR